MDRTPRELPFRPVIVAERGPDLERGRPAQAQIGYEIGSENGALLFDVEALRRLFPTFEAIYAETSAGEIWRFHNNGHLTPATPWHDEVHTPTSHDGFRIGRSDFRFGGEDATVTRMVVTTRDWQPRSVADALCHGRRNDLKNRDRIARNTPGARHQSAGNPVVDLGTGLDGFARYGEELAMLDRPHEDAPHRGVGLHGEHPYALLRTTTQGRDGHQYATWHLVTPEFAGMLPLRVGLTLDPRAANPAVVDTIYGVIDPTRRNGVSPASERPIVAPTISTDALHHLTAELSRTLGANRSVA
jgi:hypothetical protein